METKGHIITDDQFEEYQQLLMEKYASEKIYKFHVDISCWPIHSYLPMIRKSFKINHNNEEMFAEIVNDIEERISDATERLNKDAKKYQKYYQLSLSTKERVDKMMRATTIWRFLKLRRRFRKVNVID